MKKIYTLFAVAALMLGVSNAQNRDADIEVIVTEPIAGTTYDIKDTVYIGFLITNNGPDDIKPGDTLLYGLSLSSQWPQSGHILSTNTSIASGASKTFTTKATLNPAVPAGVYKLCIFANLRNSNDNLFDVDQSDNGNNAQCQSQITIEKPAGIYSDIASGKEGSVLYPNPVTGTATLKYAFYGAEKAHLSIYDMTGKNIMSNTLETTEGLNEHELDLSNLKPGVYFYRLELNGNIDHQKLTVK